MRASSGVAAGLTSLPSESGGIAPQGERFQPDLVRGSGSYAIPINAPKGVAEIAPNLSLNYSTGSGNGIFGLGWRLNILRIERRTDRGIPGYTNEDTFCIGDAEILVPVGGGRYRPKTDRNFWDIQKIDDHWKIRSGDGRTMVFGRNQDSQELDNGRIFAWYLEVEEDASGNKISYHYQRIGNRIYPQEISYSTFLLRFHYENRKDILRNGRAGFLRTTALRASKFEIHHTPSTPTLLQSYIYTYEEATNGVSLLVQHDLIGELDGKVAAQPPLKFQYGEASFANWEVHETQALVPPPSLEDPTSQLVDLTGNGLPDILQTSGSRMLLWRNNGEGWFNGPEAIGSVPSSINLNRQNVAFADLNGNGRTDLFAVDQPLQLAYEANGKGGFAPQPVVFNQTPNLRLSEPTTALMDIDGDGIIDLVETGREHFLLYKHISGTGWEDPIAVKRNANLELFPDVTLGDDSVRLADMTGDGLRDFALVRSGNVSYWPYLGNGKWGDRIKMENPPRFPEGFLEERIVLADFDTSGCDDIIYVDHDRILVWLNRTGTGYSNPIEVPVAPTGTDLFIPADFYGNGRLGLAWNAASNREYSSGHRFLQFDEGRKPYLMTTIDNSMGGVSSMKYSTTTLQRTRDEQNDKPWLGELPFIVHVLTNIREQDTISGLTTEKLMAYHDGVYDGEQREFRGFKTVTVDSPGDETIAATRQEITFFQGDEHSDDPVERERLRAISGVMVETRTYERTSDNWVLRNDSEQQWDVRVEETTPDGTIYFPFATQIETREIGIGATPNRIERTILPDYDKFGNARSRIRESLADGAPPDEVIRTEEKYFYIENETDWLVKLPHRLEIRDGNGLPFAVKITHYDGADFVGLPEGEATRGLVSRVRELKILESRLPADYIGSRDFTNMGLELAESGDIRGYYAPTTLLGRNASGAVVEQRDPLGTGLRIIYDVDNVYPLKTIDANGNETTFVFNPRAGEPTLISMSDGRQVRYEHDPLGHMLASFENDSNGHEQLVKCWFKEMTSLPTAITSVAPRSGGRTLAEFSLGTDYEALDDVSVSRVYYDGFGNEAAQVATAPDAPRGARRYVSTARSIVNARGLAATHLPPEFLSDLSFPPIAPITAAAVRYHYDALGNHEETLGPGPVHQRVVRDAFTMKHYEGDAAGTYNTPSPPGDSSRTEVFDARGRLIRIEENQGNGNAVVTNYDLFSDGRIIAVKDGADATFLSYHLAGPAQPIRITHRDVGARTYYRDAADRLRERVNPDGSALFYEYDILGRVIKMVFQSAGGARTTVRETFYDTDPEQSGTNRFLQGRVALIREGTNSFRYSYNRAGQTVREEVTTNGNMLTTNREYDLQGRATAVIYPDTFRQEYSRDRGGNITGIPGTLSKILYEADGAITGYGYDNGVTIEMPRDAASRRLLEIKASFDSNELRSVGYGFDTIGNIISLHDSLPGSTEMNSFTYDGLHRLNHFAIQQNDTGGSLIREGAYSYDNEGNILGMNEMLPMTLGYTDSTKKGRLTSVTAPSGILPVAYNALGHINAFGDMAIIEHDAFDRLQRVVKTDGTELKFAYDPQGRRIFKQVTKATTTTNVFYATGLFEQHENHAIRNIYLGNRLAASQKVTATETTSAYYLSDHHGTIILATDGAGATIHNQRYTPFGMVHNTAVALDRYLGRESDVETGLIHFGARYYSPVLGRFISPDWYIMENPEKAARLPQGYNVYGYALNNPLIFRDPSGLWFGLDDLIVIAAGFVVGFVTGLVYGLANGQGWGSFLTALETGLTTAAGAWLGWTVGGPIGLVMGGMNGLVSGVNGIYDWTSVDGWFAFLSDSTWGLIGTSLGNVLHIINAFDSDSNYRGDLSRRQNRHVYEGGIALKDGFAFTLGNVISNAGGNVGLDPSTPAGAGRLQFVADHEELHIWQSRFFGPLYQGTYIVWGVGGFLVGTVVWLFNTDESYGSIIETAAYYDNPFEYWAYNNDNNWPPGGANPVIAWS